MKFRINQAILIYPYKYFWNKHKKTLLFAVYFRQLGSSQLV